MFERLKSKAFSVAVAASLLGLTALGSAHAATPSSGADLTDIQIVYGATPLSSNRYFVVGCDGTAPSRVGRIQAIDVKTGTTAWQASVAATSACLFSVVATPDTVYAWGTVVDTDGDHGDNLLVQAWSTKDGALLWRQEIEAPNPNQGIVKRLMNNPDIAIQGSKLMILAGTTGAVNPTILLRLDAATGALLPANP